MSRAKEVYGNMAEIEMEMYTISQLHRDDLGWVQLFQKLESRFNRLDEVDDISNDQQRCKKVIEEQNKLSQTVAGLRSDIVSCSDKYRLEAKTHIQKVIATVANNDFWQSYTQEKELTAIKQSSQGDLSQSTKELMAAAGYAKNKLASDDFSQPYGLHLTFAGQQVFDHLLLLKSSIETGRDQGNFVKRRGFFSKIFGCFMEYTKKLPHGLKCILDLIQDLLKKINGDYKEAKHRGDVVKNLQLIHKIAQSKTPTCFVGRLFARIRGRNSDVQSCYSNIVRVTETFLKGRCTIA